MLEPSAQSVPAANPPKRYDKMAAVVGATMLFFALSLLDLITPSGEPINAITGFLSYGLKTAIGVAVVLIGSFAFVSTRLPAIFRLLLSCYVAVITVWFVVLIANGLQDGAVTYLLNPFFSIWAWLLVLMVPIAVKYNKTGGITYFLSRIPIIPVLTLLVISYIADRITAIGLNLAPMAIGIAFILACKKKAGLLSRLRTGLVLAILAAIMILSGDRIYFLGLSVLALSYIFVGNYRRWIFVTSCCVMLLAPILYENFKDSISNISVANEGGFDQDTRSFLFTELFQDMSASEVWTGRGFSGTYYSPYFAYIAEHESSSVGYKNIVRASSEVSWLNIILKFGLLGLLPFLGLVTFPVFFNKDGGREIDLPVDGMRRFMTMMILIFSAELPNQISISYYCWYICIGSLISASLIRKNRYNY